VRAREPHSGALGQPDEPGDLVDDRFRLGELILTIGWRRCRLVCCHRPLLSLFDAYN
jgi:hypothetical protein